MLPEAFYLRKDSDKFMNEIQLFSYGNSAVRVVMYRNPPVAWFVAKDVCDILGYANHRDAIAKHLDEDERRVSRIATPSNGGYSNITIISESGLYCLILRSNMPRAKEFRKWVTGTVLPQIRATGTYNITEEIRPIPQGVLEGAKLILETAGIKDNQLALALDSVAKHCTGESLLAISGVTLVAPTKCQLLTPTEIGKHFGVSGRKVNELLCREEYQKREGKNYEPLEAGEPYAVVLDTHKRHSDGTPVRQLKWESTFLNEIEEFFDGSYTLALPE